MKAVILTIGICLILTATSCSFTIQGIKVSEKDKKKLDDRPFLGYNETHGQKSILMEGNVDYRNKVWEWEARSQKTKE